MAETEEMPEVKPHKVRDVINIKGQNYAAGSEVMLTDEEYEAVKAAGVPFEGDEPKTDEEIQSAHDEGVEAQKAEIERRAEEEKEAEAKK